MSIGRWVKIISKIKKPAKDIYLFSFIIKMTCPMRTFPLFNFVTFIMRGIAILLPQIEHQLKEIPNIINYHISGPKNDINKLK